MASIFASSSSMLSAAPSIFGPGASYLVDEKLQNSKLEISGLNLSKTMALCFILLHITSKKRWYMVIYHIYDYKQSKRRYHLIILSNWSVEGIVWEITNRWTKSWRSSISRLPEPFLAATFSFVKEERGYDIYIYIYVCVCVYIYLGRL